MAQESRFDPYHKWLGIPPHQQPPTHYRLLGLEPFEADEEVIRAAAERQMAHIQSYKIGPQSHLSQQLLNEIARAKACLVNITAKEEYVRQLRSRSTAVRAGMSDHPHAAAIDDATVGQRSIDAAPEQDETFAPPLVSVRRIGGTKRKPQPTLDKGSSSRRHISTWVGMAIGVFLAVMLIMTGNRYLMDRRAASTRPSPSVPGATPIPSPPPARGPGGIRTPLPPGATSPIPPEAVDSRVPVPSQQELAAASRATQDVASEAKTLLAAANNAKRFAEKYVLLNRCIEAAVKAGDRETAIQASRYFEQEFLTGGVVQETLRRLETRSNPSSNPTRIVVTHPPLAPPAVAPTPLERRPVAPQMPSFGAAYPGLRLDSGRVLTEREITLQAAAIDAMFPKYGSGAQVRSFVFFERNASQPNGLFTFNTDGQLDGPALVLHGKGQGRTFLNYVANRLHGPIRIWGEDGRLLLYSEYEEGAKSGATCFFKEGQPAYAGEWKPLSNGSARIRAGLPKLVDGRIEVQWSGLDAEQQKQSNAHSSSMRTLERSLINDERKWRQTFLQWRDDIAARTAMQQAAISSASDSKVKSELERQLRDAQNLLRDETNNARQLILSEVK